MTGTIHRSFFRHQARLETALCAVLAALLLWKGVVPAWRVLNTDFPNYYLVARLLRGGYSLDRIYDWIWLQRIKDHWGIAQPLVGFAGLTPFSALPIVPLSFFSALAAKRIWILICLSLLAASAELLNRSTSLGRRRIWLLCLFAVIPLRTSFLYGQMHLPVLFFLVLAYFFHQRNREARCGASIALATALKVYPALFLLYFLWKRRWSAALTTIFTVIFIVLLSGLWMGSDVLHIYAFQILPRSMQGEIIDPFNLHAASAAAFLHRLFLFEPSLNPSPFRDSPLLYALFYPLWQVAILIPLLALLRPSLANAVHVEIEWASFTFALLVLSPVPSSYHFVVMILPAVLLVDTLLRSNKRYLALFATTLYALISIVDSVSPVHLPFARLWLSILLYALMIFSLYRSTAHESTANAPRLALLAATAIAIVAIGFVGYEHHFAQRKQEMGRHIPSPATYLATSPHPSSYGYRFIAMVPDGYRILDQNGHHIADGLGTRNPTEIPADQLSFATSRNDLLLFETADSSGSHIRQAFDTTTIVEDAQSPAISEDDRSLAFIREDKGRGSLWIEPLRDPQAQTAASTPTRLTSGNYDVRATSFLRSGLLLFAAKVNRRVSLFTVAAGSQPTLFFSSTEDIGSFAVSPNERLFTFTMLVHDRWQLATLDTLSHQVTLLTSTDCDAYTPAWITPSKILYATDCGRGLGLSSLATIDTSTPPAQ